MKKIILFKSLSSLMEDIFETAKFHGLTLGKDESTFDELYEQREMFDYTVEGEALAKQLIRDCRLNKEFIALAEENDFYFIESIEEVDENRLFIIREKSGEINSYETIEYLDELEHYIL